MPDQGPAAEDIRDLKTALDKCWSPQVTIDNTDPSRGAAVDDVRLLAHLVVTSFVAGIIWAWAQIGLPWEVATVGFILPAFGFVEVMLLCTQRILRQLEETLRRVRRVRAEWRKTFPRQRHRHRRRE